MSLRPRRGQGRCAAPPRRTQAPRRCRSSRRNRRHPRRGIGGIQCALAPDAQDTALGVHAEAGAPGVGGRGVVAHDGAGRRAPGRVDEVVFPPGKDVVVGGGGHIRAVHFAIQLSSLELVVVAAELPEYVLGRELGQPHHVLTLPHTVAPFLLGHSGQNVPIVVRSDPCRGLVVVGDVVLGAQPVAQHLASAGPIRSTSGARVREVDRPAVWHGVERIWLAVVDDRGVARRRRAPPQARRSSR